jgi:hypothetical protein
MDKYSLLDYFFHATGHRMTSVAKPIASQFYGFDEAAKPNMPAPQTGILSFSNHGEQIDFSRFFRLNLLMIEHHNATRHGLTW